MYDHPMILRIRSKREAKERIGEAFWSTYGAGFLYTLPSMLLTMFLLLIPLVWNDFPVWIKAAWSVAEFLLIMPLSFGFGIYCVARSRGKNLSPSIVFETLGRPKLYVRSLCVGAAMIVKILPIIVVRQVLIFAVPTDIAIYPLVDLLITVGGILEELFLLVMSAAYNFIYDEPAIGAWNAVTKARQLYDKNLHTVFIFFVSFFGWMLLASISLGILLPYVTAYQTVAFARMTDLLRFPEEKSES